MLEKILRKSLVIGTIFFGTTATYSCDGENPSRITSDTLNRGTTKADILNQDINETNQNSLNNCEKVYFIDQDGDNFGYKSLPIYSCEPPEGYSDNFLDCDDNNFDINPKAKEVCNGIDDNCNGIIDEGFNLTIFYNDKDGDGFGDQYDKGKYCNIPEDFVSNSNDCNDAQKSINPNAQEICDGKDNNCNGQIDENITKDCSTACGTGYQECITGKWTECNAPLAGEEICDGIDNNCNGEIDEGFEFTAYYPDKDDDGFGDNKTNPLYECKPPKDFVNINGDCNDYDENINPNIEEICNYIDDDCDGLIDLKFNEICDAYDFIFVIDNSGSMEGNDPQDIRYAGLENLVSGSWNQSDRGLVIPFAGSHKIIGSFTSDKKTLLGYINAAKNTDVGGWTTYIGFAVDDAMEQFQQNNQKRAIILLTDGGTSNDIPVISLNQKADENDIEICALGLGNSVEVAYLKALTSGVGKYLHIDNADQIPEFFQKSYIALKCQNWLECSVDNEWVTKTGKCGIN